MKVLFLIVCLSMTSIVYGQAKKVAVVKIVRGEVDVLTLGKTSRLKIDDWIEDGAMVKTAEKSFAKLVFIDKSQMNIGPNSEMKIEKFSENDAGVIDLVKGKIRSQVTKDYLQIKDKDKSKLFIKTPNAVMGIRGTDFMISTNGKNTAAILFEGEVVFNKMDARDVTNSQKLEDMVDRGVRMYPGEFSVVEFNRPNPTIPSLLNIEQRETLEKNDSFERVPSNSNESASKSVVPEGLDGKVVSNDSGILKAEIAQSGSNEKRASASSNPDGFVSGDKVKPANGSFVHIESGIIIPPGKDSILDDNTNTYIPGPEAGKITSDGSYQPPANIEITGDGKILVAVIGANGEKKIVEGTPPSPVKPSIGSTTSIIAGVGGQNPVSDPTFISPNDPSNRNGSGGVSNVSDANQQFDTGRKARTINICTGGSCP